MFGELTTVSSIRSCENRKMREVLSIGVGNVGCENLARYFNQLENYLPLEDFDQRVQFDNSQPRVIFIDHIDGFNVTEELIGDRKRLNSETIEPNKLFDVKSAPKNIKPWVREYVFKRAMKPSNFVAIDDECPNEEAVQVSQHQQLVNNMMLCEQLAKNSSLNERVEECFRINVEKCDALSGFQLVTDMVSPYYSLKCDLVQRLNDDYSSKVVLDFGLECGEQQRLTKLTKGFQSLAKLITLNRFFQDDAPNCFIPFSGVGGFIDCIQRLNSLWTLPTKNSSSSSSEHHTLNQFIYDITNTPFGVRGSGLIGCAFDPTAPKYDSLVGRLVDWRYLENGLGPLFHNAHPLVPHSNQLHTQYVCVGECGVGLFRDFSAQLESCKWRQAINFHVPAGCLNTVDIMDGFLRYNYYGAKSYSFVSPKVWSGSKNSVVSLYNTKQSYDYIYEMYRNSERCLRSFLNRIPITEQYATSYNKDTIDDLLSHTIKVLKLYDSTRAYEDFDNEIDYDD